MARALGITTVAEGVEDQAQLDELRRLGCDKVQGFLLGRPVPGTDFLNRVTELGRPSNGREQPDPPATARPVERAVPALAPPTRRQTPVPVDAVTVSSALPRLQSFLPG
jgi:hypothetical protein